MKKATLFLLLFSLTALTAQAGIIVLNGLSHQHTLRAGQSGKGQLVLRNTGDQSETVKLYARDYLFDPSGQSYFPEPGHHDRSNSAWISLETTNVVLEPGAEKAINYQIDVPDSVQWTGTYWSVIMIEGLGQLDPEDLMNKGFQVNTQVRYAVQLITHAGETGSRKMEFVDYQLQQRDSVRYVDLLLRNTGERLLLPALKMEAYDEQGELAQTINLRKRKLYPGTTLRFSIPLRALSTGTYQGLILADCGNDGVFGANVNFEIPAHLE